MASAAQRCGMTCFGVAFSILLAFLLFADSGLYDVAASRMHWKLTREFLSFGLRRAVATHSRDISAPKLEDMNLIVLGAGHYEDGCAPCHGAPGRPRNPIAERMLPNPPHLAAVVSSWSPEELFWIVKHGLKYTGMPAWAATARDDDVWSVVAFLRKLPETSPDRYRLLATGGTGRSNQIIALGAANHKSDDLANCTRCHGRSDLGSALVPRLAGQPQSYLEQSLHDFTSGLRQSGVMQPIAATLDTETLKAISSYFSKLEPSRAKAPMAEDGAIGRGREIATRGVAETNVPACRICHSETASPNVPRLDGQYALYIEEQLRLWRKGLRRQSGNATAMRIIASRLSEAQAKDVAAYFENVTRFQPSPPLAKR